MDWSSRISLHNFYKRIGEKVWKGLIRVKTSIDVPEELWKKFGLWCMANDRTRTGILIDCMLKVIEDSNGFLDEFLARYAKEVRKEKE